MKIPTILLLSAILAAVTARADTIGAAPGEFPEVNHYVYLSELPEPGDLTKDAAANGLTITRLDRTSDRVVVSYRYPDGHTATLGYALLGAVGSTDRVVPAPRVVTERRTTVIAPEPEVVYVEPRYPTRYYSYRDPVDDFWLPLTLGVGLGWATSYHGHYHGGWHGGWHGGHHGGWRR